MPYIIRPRQTYKIATGLLVSLMLLFAAPTLAHAASCAKPKLSYPFASKGDSAAYSLVPEGTFTSGAKNWALTNAAVVNKEGDPEVGPKALVIQPDGNAVSPAVCVSAEYPTFRFYVRRTAGPFYALLNVGLRWSDATGTHEIPAAFLPQFSSEWSLSPVLDLAGRLPLAATGGTMQVQFVFQPLLGGTFEIDDVYVDPYSR